MKKILLLLTMSFVFTLSQFSQTKEYGYGWLKLGMTIDNVIKTPTKQYNSYECNIDDIPKSKLIDNETWYDLSDTIIGDAVKRFYINTLNVTNSIKIHNVTLYFIFNKLYKISSIENSEFMDLLKIKYGIKESYGRYKFNSESYYNMIDIFISNNYYTKIGNYNIVIQNSYNEKKADDYKSAIYESRKQSKLKEKYDISNF